MDIEDCRLYFNYRIILKAKSEGYLKTTRKQNEIAEGNFENNDFYAMFKTRVENEIGLLNKFKIKPVKTNRLINYYGKNSVSPALPQFLHIYDRTNLFDEGGYLESKIRPANGIFLTSSRFKDAKIYKPGAGILNALDMHIYNAAGNTKFDFICIGTNSEAEIKFIKNFSGNPMLIILPSNSLLKLTILNKIAQNFLQISALDPFSKNSRYGLVLRNSLAFHLSQEMAILYLSQKSSLSALIEKFRNSDKKIKIFSEEGSSGLNGGIQAKSGKVHDRIRQFIINSLEKENLAIDNLLKLSNIKLNVNEKEIIKAISILEMNSEIERCPGGIIKKI